jgi:hypothetical protein
MLLVTIFIHFVITVTSTPIGSFEITISEHGTVFNQQVTNGDELQIYETPAHNGYEHIIAYVDYRGGYELIKRIAAGVCELSKLETDVQYIQEQPTRQTIVGPVDSAKIQRVVHEKFVNSDPMIDTNFLRHELRDACRNLPIHWADTAPEQKSVVNGILTINGTRYIVSRSGINYNEWTCSHYNPLKPPCQGVGAAQTGICNPSCTYQLCFPNIGQSCYYRIRCGPESMVLSDTCLQHINNPGNYCRMCCTDPRYTCGSGCKYKHCGCPNESIIIG